MSTGLLLDARHAAIVRDILRTHVPPATRVRVFGSRAGGAVKPFSDLDLSLDAGRPLTLAERATLAAAFEESPLPWRVDLVDMHAISAEFAARIASRAIAFDLQ